MVFSTVFNLSLNFCNKELMIWVTVSPRSYFCWLYRASPFGGKEYNQSDFSIDHLVISMCRVIHCVVGSGCLLWPARSLGKTLLAFSLLHFVFQGQTCLLLQVSLDFLLLHSSPLWWKGHLFFVLVQKVFIEPLNFSFFSITGQGIDLDYWAIDGLPWKWTEIILSFLRLHSSTAFMTLLLTMRATPFLLRDSFPQ